MKKNSKKAMSSAMVMALVIAAALPGSLAKAAAGEVTKVGTSDSYETAAKVATANWTTSKDVVLVCGEGYADAVSATVLAKQLDAPILLTTAASLNSNAKAALEQLKPENIYIIGGTASVSKAVRNELSSDGYNLIELSGKNRYETNIAVANELVKLGVSADNVMLVSGEGFSDVLSATPIAAANGQIILLGNNNKSTMESVLSFIKDNNSKVTVVGTANSINSDMYDTLGAVKRINGGSDRFHTNLNVLNSFGADLNVDKLFIANASGGNYADALIAASLAGKYKSPLVLVDDDNSSSTSDAISYIKGKVSSSTDLNFIGGTDVDNVISKINSSLSTSSSTPTVDSATVKSVTAVGLSQVKVVFNTEVDKDSAESIKNYEIDGDALGSSHQTQASVNLQDDNRTVVITFTNPFPQYKDVTFTVKNAVLNKSESTTIPSFQQGITFSETSVPTLESVTARGGNRLIVKFSEAIRLDSSDLASMKINRQSITSFGLNKTETVFTNQSGDWADGVELYFNSPLPIGNNTFTVPNGDAGSKFDNAGNFPIKSASLNFTVDSTDGSPQVNSVTSDNSDTVYIHYNRAMDKQTALEDSNYKINNTTVSVSSADISFEEGSDDTIVKIEDVGDLLKEGENTITIDDNIEDTYGNEINQASMNLYVGSDTVKPQVSNVTITDSDTMRVKFNKDVSSSSATTKGNYKIVDSNGTDISYKINYVTSVYVDGNSKKTFDIKFTDDDALKGLKYTVTVKNIYDTNSVANVMDPYTTVLSGTNDEQPTVTEIVRRSDNAKAVAIFFNKIMDQDSITNPQNYYFKDGTGETRKLPSSAVITPSLDCRSVTIEFPSSFIIGSGSGEKHVVIMGVSNVKDTEGNTLETIAYSSEIGTDYSEGPKLIDDSSTVAFDGDDIKVKVSLTAPLDVLNLNDFKLNGQVPDTGVTVGNDVLLTFKAGVKNNEKIDKIKSAGSNATLSIYSNGSVDAAGRSIISGSDIVYLPPTTVSDSWRASSTTGRNTVTIVFNQDIDNDITSSYYDDFIFKNERTGQTIVPVAITVDGRNVIYRFNNGTIKSGDNIDVRANNITSNVNIRSEEHNDSYTLYTPSKDDLKDRVITSN